MSAVWQTLIPETPSTEPIAETPATTIGRIPATDDDEELTSVITSSSTAAAGVGSGKGLHIPNHHNKSHCIIPPIIGTAHQRNSITANHNHIHSNNNSNSKSQGIGNRFTSSSSTPPTTSNRISAQFWRFYSDRTQKRSSYDKRKRLFLKGGEWNTYQVNVFERGSRYLGDIFTTLVDAQWRWTLFVFSFSYVSSWIFFAVLWWIILVAHGDIEHFGQENWAPCVEEVKNFASVFLFSVETQHTIGYGHHRMTDNCAEAIVVLCFQSIAGVLIEAFMVGVVFAKLSRPKKRSVTLAFSNHAVICQRDGGLYLMFRVGDLRNRSHIFEAHVRAQVITKKVTPEGEVIPIHQEEIKVGGYGEDEDRILLFWPTLILHPIDSESPFYSMSPNDLLKAKLELLVVMEGVVESTGMTTQARTSYLPSEILWGQRFQNLTTFKSDTGQHVFDFDLFNSTFPVDTPLCSARDLDQLRNLKSDGLSEGDRQLASSSSSNNNEETASMKTHNCGSNCNNNNNIDHCCTEYPVNRKHSYARSISSCSIRTNKSHKSQNVYNCSNNDNHNSNDKIKSKKQSIEQLQCLNTNIELSMIGSRNNSGELLTNNLESPGEESQSTTTTAETTLYNDNDKAPLFRGFNDDEEDEFEEDEYDENIQEHLIESHINIEDGEGENGDDELESSTIKNTNNKPNLANCNKSKTTNTANTNHNNNFTSDINNPIVTSSSRRRLSRSSIESFQFSDSNV